MADQGFYPNWGNDMIYAKWGWMLNFYNRPAADGSGGGDGNGVKDSVAEEFDAIRGVIDSRVAKWQGLPDGAACATPRSAANSTTAVLGGPPQRRPSRAAVRSRRRTGPSRPSS
ncbi:hypothetical protein [Demequina litorisediminis]|nr:hypothetical protein [Demequina litorisediminis]